MEGSWQLSSVVDTTQSRCLQVYAGHDLLLKFGVIKEDRVKVIKNLGRTRSQRLDQLDILFRSYWELQDPEYPVDPPVY
jgi:hypothetical protein